MSSNKYVIETVLEIVLKLVYIRRRNIYLNILTHQSDSACSVSIWKTCLTRILLDLYKSMHIKYQCNRFRIHIHLRNWNQNNVNHQVTSNCIHLITNFLSCNFFLPKLLWLRHNSSLEDFAIIPSSVGYDGLVMLGNRNKMYIFSNFSLSILDYIPSSGHHKIVEKRKLLCM